MGQDDLAAVPRPIRENGGLLAGAYDRRGAKVSRMNSISLDVDGLIEQLLSVRGEREKGFERERERSAAGSEDGTPKSAVTLSQQQWFDDVVRPKSKIIQEQFAFFCSRTYTTSKIVIDEIIFSHHKLQVKVAVVCFLAHGHCSTSRTPTQPTSHPSRRSTPPSLEDALPVA